MTFVQSRALLTPIGHADAKSLIEQAHYLGKLGSTSVRLGLTYAGELAGVAASLPPKCAT